jgi:hypothetical protein
MNPPGVRPADVARAAHELLAHDRPWTAIDLLAGTTHRSDSEQTSMTSEIVDEALAAALTKSPNEARIQSLGYELGRLLDYLDANGTPAIDLARYEFMFFQLLDRHRTPRAGSRSRCTSTVTTAAEQSVSDGSAADRDS